MINQNFIYLAFAINTLGSLSYVIATLKGKTKPNRVSWTMWTIAPFIAFAAELSKGVGVRSLATFAVGFGPLMILIASFINKKAYWKITNFDLLCGAMSAIALILWALTGSGDLAIVFSIASDFLAAVPTLRKSYTHPHTENGPAFMLSSVAMVITLLTISEWNFATYAFPVYILLINITFSVLIMRPKLRFNQIKAD